MNRNYLFLIAVGVILAVGMLFMSDNTSSKQTDAEALLYSTNDPSRFLSLDVIADRLVKGDPSLIVVDVRPADQFKTFSLPGAINIPIDSLLTPSALNLMKADEFDKVFISNSDAWSDQAWILYRRLDIPNIFVMRGGVNGWFANIAQPIAPEQTAAQEVFDLYSFRMAVNQHFYGSPEIAKPIEPVKKPVVVTRKVQEVETGGGC